MITQSAADQKEFTPRKDHGEGKFTFTLGRGASGVFGHVELTILVKQSLTGLQVQWQPKNGGIAAEARVRIEDAIVHYLSKYLITYPDFGFVVIVTNVHSDAARRNDYERAARTALRFALEDVGLPVPQIFGL